MAITLAPRLRVWRVIVFVILLSGCVMPIYALHMLPHALSTEECSVRFSSGSLAVGACIGVEVGRDGSMASSR